MTKKRGNKIETFNGFIKQVPRAMHYLIDGAYSVSIEAEDDVSVLDENGKIVLVEQLKTKCKVNVFADSSPDLWGTLYNWIYNYVNEEDKTRYTDNAEFVLYTTKKNSRKGVCLEQLLNLGQDSNFDNVIATCENTLSSSTDEIKSYIEYIKSNKEAAYTVIKNFSVKVPEENISTDLDNLITNIYSGIHTDDFTTFTERLNGWYYQQIVNRENEALKKCTITKADFEKFKAHLHSYQTKVKYAQGILPPDEVAKLERELFVEQLNAINFDEDAILTAKKSYTDWKNCEEKDLLMGRVTQDVLNDTYSNLKDSWNSEKNAISNVIYPTEDAQGKFLYNKVQDNSVFIDGVELQGDKKVISRGAHNYLANKDTNHAHSIGWHPDYKNKFKDWSRDA